MYIYKAVKFMIFLLEKGAEDSMKQCSQQDKGKQGIPSLSLDHFKALGVP